MAVKKSCNMVMARAPYRAIFLGGCAIFVLMYAFLNQSALTPQRNIDKPDKMLKEISELQRKPLSCDNKMCDSAKAVALAKTHKTGGSTLQNIFLRFGSKHDLTFAFPEKSWMFSLKERFNSSLVLDGPFRSLGFDMFVSHSIWTFSEVQKVMPSYAKYVTILRDPVDVLESNYVFMGAQKAQQMDINGYAKKFAHRNVQRNPKAYVGRNNLLWDLGMNIDDMGDKRLVENYIKQLDLEFDLVLITERFDESVIIMQNDFCWPQEDVTYAKQLERVSSERNNITQETRELLKKWLWADYMLYDHFVDKLNKRVAEFGEDRMRKEVESLKKANENVYKECVTKKANKEELQQQEAVGGVQGVYGYELDETKKWCVPIFRRETEFAKMIREYQYYKVEKLNQIRGIVAKK